MGASPSGIARIHNPYTPGMPLFPGSPTFYGREELFQVVRQSIDAVAPNGILVLTGQRRIGKTSVLKHLPAHLDPARYLCVYVDGNGLGIDPGMEGFYLSLIEDVVLGLEQAGISMPRVSPEALGHDPQRFFEHQFLREVHALIGERTLLLTLDEFEELGARVSSGGLPASVFSYVRHLIRRGEKLAFVFSGAHRLEQMDGDHWSVLHGLSVYKRIGFLQEDAVRRLITEPVKTDVCYDVHAVREIVRLTAGHPYFVQLLCHLLVDRCNDDGRSYVTKQNVCDALDELLDLGGAHLIYLWSTSDQEMRVCVAALAELQARTDGVTAAAIMNRLRDYGLDLEPEQIQGTLYTLVERDLVVAEESPPITYSLTAQLYADWLCRYRPLSRVIE